jgi:hypothetical protein
LVMAKQSRTIKRRERPQSIWRVVGEQLAEEHEAMMSRFDDLEEDVAELKTDVAELKTDVGGLKEDVAGVIGQLGRMERSNEEFQRHTAMQFERLVAYIERDEKKDVDPGKGVRS